MHDFILLLSYRQGPMNQETHIQRRKLINLRIRKVVEETESPGLRNMDLVIMKLSRKSSRMMARC